MSVIGTHVPIPGRHEDARGVKICETCGGLVTDRVHKVPESDEESRRVEARRIGEADE